MRMYIIFLALRILYKNSFFRTYSTFCNKQIMFFSSTGVIPFAGGSFLAYHCLDEYSPLSTDTTEIQMIGSACMAAACAQVHT